mmetsp:Transcript_29240/g.82515  ORF Transcript_29240/g.82515 Transcript_29240/m.82515 type:complete len:534 (-) Transcript_29240:354-1955(-)|eukprot:CAMPEP_0117680398 /NCGR_PEP_ID=MMETSP0804-20121206/18331_1 /TAXON_ID=1074897 /ORGANISM="Tetraselmis astigmatica, Strain CCMP880" /LENGTH=533 /DNA_ID=CAMNT_0005489893 /DNA_START=228 /DNA_END=1829 /DNA_ORIENTATION=-
MSSEGDERANPVVRVLGWPKAELSRRWDAMRQSELPVEAEEKVLAAIDVAAQEQSNPAYEDAPKRRFPGNPILRNLAEQRWSERQLSRRKGAAGDKAEGSGAEEAAKPSTSGTVLTVCAVEVTKGRKRVYSTDGHAFQMVDDEVLRFVRLRNVLHSYLLPNGYPHSVAPEYSSYMFWRGVQYFFGGAMSVFTTRALLGALGVNGRGANASSAAINWVLKDGAGRLGRFLFARWGWQLDCELKQFRLAGDLLMEAGAALELTTIAFPGAFLPLACTANLAKNLAAVAASATRAPIYRTFAIQNNMADVTAKGESVANLADIAGTLFGIGLATARLPLVPSFVALSCGYLYASRMEVDSVVLPYLNRARLAYTSRRYLESGMVPDIYEANKREPLLPWRDQCGQGELLLGARVEAACSGPAQLVSAIKRFDRLPYAITYRPDAGKVMVLLKESATQEEFMQAAFHGYYILQRTQDSRESGDITSVEQSIQQSVKDAPRMYRRFLKAAERRGWYVNATMLSVEDHRLRFLDPLPVY